MKGGLREKPQIWRGLEKLVPLFIRRGICYNQRAEQLSKLPLSNLNLKRNLPLKKKFVKILLSERSSLKNLKLSKNAASPFAGEPQDYGGLFSPRVCRGAKNVRANLRIVHHFGYVKLSASPLRGSAAKLYGKLKEKINFWFRIVKENFYLKI